MTKPFPSRRVSAPGASRVRTAGGLACLALVAVSCLLWDSGHEARAQERSAAPQAPADNACKVPADNSAPGRRIFYGEPAPNEKSAVGIAFNQGGEPSLCTGVVISSSAILTAGHCSCGSNYELRFGEEMKAPEASVRVRRIARYPGYDCGRHLESQPGVDYAVMTFEPNDVPADADTGQRARPARIMTPRAAQQSVLKPSSSLSVVGYGRTQRLEIGFRMAADIPVLSWDCAERWAEARGCLPFAEIVLSELGQLGFRPDGRNRDSCGGDSGGPAFAVSVEKDECSQQPIQKSYLVAITSRGMRLNRGEGGNKICGGGGIYEIVARHSVVDWLHGLGIDFNVEQKPAE